MNMITINNFNNNNNNNREVLENRPNIIVKTRGTEDAY
jgi:hypothetical protein